MSMPDWMKLVIGGGGALLLWKQAGRASKRTGEATPAAPTVCFGCGDRASVPDLAKSAAQATREVPIGQELRVGGQPVARPKPLKRRVSAPNPAPVPKPPPKAFSSPIVASVASTPKATKPQGVFVGGLFLPNGTKVRGGKAVVRDGAITDL